MKFSGIKVGDTIFTRKMFEGAFGVRKPFFIPNSVVDVSKIQFTTECGSVFNKDGCREGKKNPSAFKLGDKLFNETVKDDSIQAKAFVYKFSLEKRLNKIASTIKCPLDSGFSLSQLENMITGLEKISNTLNKTNHEI